MRAWSSAAVGEDAVAMVVCLWVETTIFQRLGRLWKPRATETLWGALAWFAGIQWRRQQLGTDLDRIFDDGSGEWSLSWFARIRQRLRISNANELNRGSVLSLEDIEISNLEEGQALSLWLIGLCFDVGSNSVFL